MTKNRPRLAIAVDPPLLGFSLLHILGEIGTDEVVNLSTKPAREIADGFDVAVVSPAPFPEVTAAVIIELPDREGNSGVGRVVRRGSMELVLIDGPEVLLELLDRFCAGPRSRAAPDLVARHRARARLHLTEQGTQRND